MSSMRLDLALVERGLSESRTEAKELIVSGYVLVDGIVVSKKTRQVDNATTIEVTARRRFVSRGGEKLSAALIHVYQTQDSLRAHIEGKCAIDVGSSTGGFTDCLLSYGLAHGTCVDVGTNQLHQKLREDSRVTLFENTDIRNYTIKEKEGFSIIVADLSFISIDKVVDKLIDLGEAGAIYFLLIKPQFEVGKGNTKKGIVKDMNVVITILEKYETLFKSKNLNNVTIFPCAITGGDGNQEYFLYGKK